jgi:sugar phosphate isomerase/epimerase
MKAIALYSDSLSELTFEAMLDWCAAHGVEAVELGTGNFSSAPHCSLVHLLESDAACADFQEAISRRGLFLAALNCSGNVLDPDSSRRTVSQQVLRDTVLLAVKLGLKTIVTMSGCPGEKGKDVHFPNWVTTYWQSEFRQLLEWQWADVVEPFWREMGRFAADRGVRVAVEMHPGQAAYNLRTLLRLREAGGMAVGANLDPSHLIWQGMDTLRVARMLGEAVYYVHAKDCRMDANEISLNGVLETHMSTTHAWEHCLPGEGQPETFWRSLVVELENAGYTGPLSIEYAGPQADRYTGIDRTVALLRRVRSANGE